MRSLAAGLKGPGDQGCKSQDVGKWGKSYRDANESKNKWSTIIGLSTYTLQLYLSVAAKKGCQYTVHYRTSRPKDSVKDQ